MSIGSLKEALDLLADHIESVGGCDHAVNICVCGDKSTLETGRETLAAVEAALKPFAEFAAVCVPNAESFEAPDDYVVAVIHGPGGATTINAGHLRAAIKALE